MEIWYALLATFAACSIAFSVLLWKILPPTIKSLTEAYREARLAEVATIDKAMALIASRDPLTFQQLQAMNGGNQYDVDYDPSDEGEMARIHERLGERDDTEERMTDGELGLLDDIFPGSGFAGNTVQ